VALVFPDYYLVDKYGNNLEIYQRHDFEKDVTLLDQPAHGACTMIRKDVLTELGGYDQTFTRQDGYDLWLSIDAKYKVTNVNLPLFHYRQHSKSITKDEKKLLETRSKIKEKHVQKRHLDPISVLGIVPVRGGEMDHRSHPLAMLGEKRLIDWTLDYALESNKLIDIIVTTPDIKIIKHVNNRYDGNVLTIQRSRDLAKLNTGVEQTAIDALKHYSQNHELPDALMMLYIEYPFRSGLSILFTNESPVYI